VNFLPDSNVNFSLPDSKEIPTLKSIFIDFCILVIAVKIVVAVDKLCNKIEAPNMFKMYVTRVSPLRINIVFK
jgi:hypothetical protein